MGNSSLRSINAEQLDATAWSAILNWPKHARFHPIHRGFNYAELARYFLWDKVGRALRKQHFPQHFDFELSVYSSPTVLNSWPWEPVVTKKSVITEHQQPFIRKFRTKLAQCGIRRSHQLDLLVPYPNDRLEPVVRELLSVGDLNIGVSRLEAGRYSGATLIDQVVPIAEPDADFCTLLRDAIEHGLKACEIELLNVDLQLLTSQLHYLVEVAETQKQLLYREKPRAVLVHSDNHPPFQAAILAARELKIPTIMVQHGLDCERFYLNNAYAASVAVWGNARFERYRTEAEELPRRLEITGNPGFDTKVLCELMVENNGDWIWVTRPHASTKCYSPSRLPIEGIWIMESLCRALKMNGNGQRLLIKPHPFDYRFEYIEVAARYGLEARVRLVDGPLEELFKLCNVVISEDSTAGLEAIIEGKLLIHAHFAATPPTVPFVDYGVALPGFSDRELENSLLLIPKLSQNYLNCLARSQKSFLAEYCGPLDGNAAKRVTTFVRQEIEKI